MIRSELQRPLCCIMLMAAVVSAGPESLVAELDRRVRAFLEKVFYDPSVAVPSDPIKFSPLEGH